MALYRNRKKYLNYDMLKKKINDVINLFSVYINYRTFIKAMNIFEALRCNMAQIKLRNTALRCSYIQLPNTTLFSFKIIEFCERNTLRTYIRHFIKILNKV